MAQDQFKRKLTTIFSADVAGYSRLMGEDEAATVKTLEQYKQVMSELIRQHRGRVIDSPGDNLLAEFTSVVDAVQCAVATQKELQARNAELPENRRMQFRIGVNLGDVIEEESRIYGDGVNIAARLESLAEPGGICVSKTAFDQIETKLPFGYEYLGEQSVKNIVKPVGAYRVLMEPRVTIAGAKASKVSFWRHKTVLASAMVLLLAIVGAWFWILYWHAPEIEPASREKMALSLPDLPSIAVLPFTNMSEDPKQDFLCDGITENIITALSKVPRLFVIARNSTFAYKGKPANVKQVSEELGVQYVLEGSVQRVADRIRVTAQLIDALKGNHLWAERYDRELMDLFALQDEITLKILNAIQVKLTEGQTYWATANIGGKEDLDCYLKAMEALTYVQRANIEDIDIGRGIAEQAIAMCPEALKPYMLMASIHMMDYWFGTSKSPKQSIRTAIELAQKSLAVDDTRAEAHSLLGQLYCLAKKWDQALSEGERGVALNPGGADANYWYASTLTFAGRPEEAVLLFEKAIRLNPFGPSRYFLSYGHALCSLGRLEDAVSAYKKALQREPKSFFAHLRLAATYSMMGRELEAKAEAEEVLRLNPKFTLDYLAKVSAYKDRTETDKIINSLRDIGLPDKPQLPFPDKPSIAVLPFVNMSDDKSQEYFSDGLTEEIITALSKTPKLFVISRNSTFVYKGKAVDVKQVSRELGVKYVLEGSVRWSGDQLRITAQLIDAATGNHLWAERYDRSLEDIFAVQDEITKKIFTALQVELTEGEQTRVYERGTKNLEAYLKALQAAAVGRNLNPEANVKARRLAEEALALDPYYASAFRELGATHIREVWLRIAKSPKDALEKAAAYAKKALTIDESLPPAHMLIGQVYLLRRDFDNAILEGQRLVELDPNGAESHWYLGLALVFSGKPEEAIQSTEKAIRLCPFAPSHYYHILALSHWCLGRYDKAIEQGEIAVKLAPKNQLSVAILTMSYGSAGRMEEATTQAANLLKINPKYCVGRPEEHRFKDPAYNEAFKKTLNKAGVPYCASP